MSLKLTAVAPLCAGDHYNVSFSDGAVTKTFEISQDEIDDYIDAVMGALPWADDQPVAVRRKLAYAVVAVSYYRKVKGQTVAAILNTELEVLGA